MSTFLEVLFTATTLNWLETFIEAFAVFSIFQRITYYTFFPVALFIDTNTFNLDFFFQEDLGMYT